MGLKTAKGEQEFSSLQTLMNSPIGKYCNAVAPRGYSYIGTGYGVGGPANADATGSFDKATSWQRVTSNKNCKMIELVTRES